MKLEYEEKFPRRLQLWQGAILATIARAIWIAHHPTLSYELSWDGPNYNRQDSMGTRGTVTFTQNSLVGVFRDEHSPRSPLGLEGDYDLASFLKGMPSTLLSLANEQALQYVVEEHKGVTAPIITAAFWSEGDYLTSAEPWAEVVAHGAYILRKEFMDTEDAIAAWQEDCELSSVQVRLLRSVFTCKMAAPDTPLVLGKQERDILVADGDEGMDDSRELLAAVGITLA